MSMTRRLLIMILGCTTLLLGACGPARASTHSLTPAPVWGAVGDSITFGWGSSDPATKAYPVLAGVPAAANPGQCLVASGCWGTPLVSTFATEIAWLRTTRGGVNAVVVEIGVNDLPQNITDTQYVDAYRLLVSTGKAYGTRVILSTITPRRGLSAAQEAQRERINTWIRARDRRVDYAAALGGDTLLPAYDSGDGLHPSDAGHAAMAARLVDWIAAHPKLRVPSLTCVRAPCGTR